MVSRRQPQISLTYFPKYPISLKVYKNIELEGLTGFMAPTSK